MSPGREGALRSLNRTLVTRGAAFLAALSVLASPLPAAARTDGEGKLSILSWAGYVERGENDKAFDWVTPFERATGCKVTVRFAGSSEEMVAQMRDGTFDLVTASGDASLRLIAARSVQEIDIKRVPSWNSIDPRLRDAPWQMVGGRHYGVPFQWGPNFLLYNTKLFRDPPKSWSLLFEEQDLPDGKPNTGRVQAYDSPMSIADAAVYLRAKRPDLGITDPYALDEKQYAAALDALRAQRHIVQKYWNDGNVQVNDFAAEEAVAAVAWPFQLHALVGLRQPVAWTLPDEGGTGWADTIMLGANAHNPNCAYLWLEHSLRVKTQGDVAAWFGSVPVVLAACKSNALLTNDGCRANGLDLFDRLSFWRTPVAQCGEKRTCVPYAKWMADFQAIRGRK